MNNLDTFDIIICPFNIKKNILKNNQFLNIKFMNINEFKEKYLFKYKPDTIYYLVKKYNLIPENAKIIMNNLFYIKDVSKKTHELVKIKEDLIENNYIIFDGNFKKYIKDKNIAIIGYEETKEIRLLFKDLKYTCINEKIKTKKIKIYEAEDNEAEVTFIATKITDLIINGIDINKIKIIKTEEIYTSTINKVFSFFNIPYIENNTSLYSLTEVREILKNINLDNSIEEYINEIQNSNIIDKLKIKILNILNKYHNKNIKDIYEIFIYELKTNKIEKNLTNAVEIITIDQIEDDNYNFILGFNQDLIPKIYQDNDYLSDYELNLLNLDNSLDKNEIEKNKIKKIFNKDNITITYKQKTAFQNYTISNLYEELDYEIKKIDYDYTNLKTNQILLGTKLDEFIKYNTKDEILNDLYGNILIPYNTYNNNYNKIDKIILKEKIKNLNLSFSNVDIFYKCQFRFYIENILKIKKNKETISLEIGNIFHKVLEKYYSTKENIELILDDLINKNYKDKKDKFYKEKYKKIIVELVNIIDNQLENTSYENKYFEKWFSIEKDKDLNIKVVGKIDKIMILNDGVNNYIIVVDYKTGVLHADFNKVIHGMDMQLLFYLYLIKNTDLIDNPIFTGMYLEPIFTSVLKAEKGKTYEELKKNSYKWVGYTLENTKKVREIDKNFEYNSFINGLRVKNDGTFYSTSKVITEEDINKLLDIVSNNIDFVLNSIKNADFKINPKRIGKKNVSCEFCPYQDICYKTNNNLVNLKEYKNLEFLGGEE